MDVQKFVENVEILCKLKGVTATKACLESGLSRSFLTDVKGKSPNPRIESLEKLTAYFGVTTSELLGEVPIKHTTGVVLHENVQQPRQKLSKSAEETAMAYDRATPELRSAVRRVLGLPEAPPAAKDKAM